MANSRVIILLETATDSCSAALSDGEKIIAEKYADVPKAHATLLARFTEDILKDNNFKVSDCAAVAVSEGPGSYTGLRVGASLAKGICYGADLPLIGIGTPAVIAQCALDNAFIKPVLKALADDFYIVPMIDAGRMEVYAAVFNSEGEQLTKTDSVILDSESFKKEIGEKPVLFTGNGAAKFKKLLSDSYGNKDGSCGNSYLKNVRFAEQLPHAAGLRVQAFKALKNNDFRDRAYFQPFYLKDFIPGKPKKLL